MKFLSLIGARPQFVKAGVISRAIQTFNTHSPSDKITEIILHTGQHFDKNMSDSFLEEFKIRPTYNLGIREALHGKMTARMIEGIEAVLIQDTPSVIIVYGDTNSTLAGALAASKLHIPIAHVEAGLRSFNMKMPEEINRILTDRISTWLFCPTLSAVKNLENEGMKSGPHHVMHTGDVMLDAFRRFQKTVKSGPRIKKMLGGSERPFYLATIHRGENTDVPDRLVSIFSALETIAEKRPVVVPLHPRTKKRMAELNVKLRRVQAIEPVSYPDMIALLEMCTGVFTDSGGLQKEAYFMNRKCVTLRDETEWVELVEQGGNTLAGADEEKILSAEAQMDSVQVDWGNRLYGDGTAGETIVKNLVSELS